MALYYCGLADMLRLLQTYNLYTQGFIYTQERIITHPHAGKFDTADFDHPSTKFVDQEQLDVCPFHVSWTKGCSVATF